MGASFGRRLEKAYGAATAVADSRECPNDVRGLLVSYREGLTHDSAQSHEEAMSRIQAAISRGLSS